MQAAPTLSAVLTSQRKLAGKRVAWPSRDPCNSANPYRAFLQSLVVPLELVPNHIGQKLFAPLTCLEKRAVQDGLKFTKNSCSFRVIGNTAVALIRFVLKRFCCRTRTSYLTPTERPRPNVLQPASAHTRHRPGAALLRNPAPATGICAEDRPHQDFHS
jgi:hypothetical protein